MAWIATLKRWARELKTEVIALWLCSRHQHMPWLARLVALLVVAYALSPIDLIPDFIPLLGYLDDLLLVPLGIWLAIRLTPPTLLAECRARAREVETHPRSHPQVAR
ncbi:YkvA family protein, partial [Pseudomonas aeruginosa]|nr:YkvA family protein [Pseudomonas aeruginosa]